MAKQGSVTLVVLMILSVLAVAGFTILRNTTFLLNGALAREQYTKHYYATEALMHYGIRMVKYYFEAFKQHQKEVEFNIDAWPLPESSYKGKLFFNLANQDISIRAMLEKEDHIYCFISCLLVCDKEGILEIRDWQIK